MENSEQMKKTVQRWFLVQGDKNLRLFYPLRPDSIVFDVGGYHGDWAVPIAELYHCKCYIFEPIAEYASIIRGRCGTDPRYSVHNFALGRGDGEFAISSGDDATSAFKSSGTMLMAQQRDLVAFLRESAISRIALMKINIEGGEFDLLDYIIETGVIAAIDDIQVQFHEFIDNAREKREALRKRLSITHDLIYDFPFIWESWSKKA